MKPLKTSKDTAGIMEYLSAGNPSPAEPVSPSRGCDGDYPKNYGGCISLRRFGIVPRARTMAGQPLNRFTVAPENLSEHLIRNRTLLTRVANIGMLIAVICILFIARWLHPDARGLGTHEQLFFNPCTFYTVTGVPCPSCGMTTAFAYMARGQVVEALKAQPMGALGFVACVALLPLTIAATLKDRYFFLIFVNLPWKPLGWALGLMFMSAWIFKTVLFFVT